MQFQIEGRPNSVTDRHQGPQTTMPCKKGNVMVLYCHIPCIQQRSDVSLRHQHYICRFYTTKLTIKFLTQNLLLRHKAEAFLGRKNIKCRGAFDIKVLRDSGAELDGNLKIQLEDGVVSDRVEDPDFLDERIAAVTPSRCEAELKEYLPEEVYRQLAKNEFESLRESLRDLFAEWLEQ